MGSKLMNCPTCSHSVNNIAGACPYCGANMSQEAHQPQSDAIEVVENEPTVEPQPPLPPEEPPSEPDLATDAVIDSGNESDSVEEDSESQTLDDERKLKLGPEFEELTMDGDGGSEIASTITDDSQPDLDTEGEPPTEVNSDMQGPESEKAPAFTSIDPIAQQQETPSEIDADEIPLPPEPEVVETAVDEPAESDTIEENIVEMTEIEATQQELDTQLAPETFPPPEESAKAESTVAELAESAETDSADEIQSKIEAEKTTDDEADFSSDAAGDTIVLEAMDEVQPSTQESSDKIVLESIDEVQPSTQDSSDKTEETAKLDSPAEALKIEKAAQVMAAAIEKQKAALAESQKIKKQKAALAKAQALKSQKAEQAKVQAQKKQKMILAKAAALKRKKAARSKAQALKKQRNAQAGIESTKRDDIATTLEANTKMQSLLEKYKGRAIGINYDNSADIREAQLVEANGEYFSVYVQDENLHYSYPLKTILTVIEGKYGVDSNDSEKTDNFNAVIKVYPLIPF